MLPKLALYTGDGGMSAAYDRRSVGASLLLHHAKSGNARNSNATLKQQRSQPNSFVISPPMRAWLEQPHGRRHKAPPQPWAKVKITPVQKVSLISCARPLVTTAPPSARGACLMAADQAPRRARSMRLRSSHIFNGVTQNCHATSFHAP